MKKFKKSKSDIAYLARAKQIVKLADKDMTVVINAKMVLKETIPVAIGTHIVFDKDYIQKAGIDERELASVLSKCTVQMARLSYEVMAETNGKVVKEK